MTAAAITMILLVAIMAADYFLRKRTIDGLREEYILMRADVRRLKPVPDTSKEPFFITLSTRVSFLIRDKKVIGVLYNNGITPFWIYPAHLGDFEIRKANPNNHPMIGVKDDFLDEFTERLTDSDHLAYAVTTLYKYTIREADKAYVNEMFLRAGNMSPEE